MPYTRQYEQFLKPEVRVSRSQIRPRNIYRISTYAGGDPATKTAEQARYVFVIGKVENKIHCIKLNEIRPVDFTKFINRLRDKRIPIESDQALDELLKKFTKDGRQLFETYVKKNPKVYLSEKPNYRTYILENIQYCYEIRFEDGFLRQLFGEGSNTTTQRQVIENEINENDG
jgi:hypothetical protein